jgi:hypothetical protein
MNESMPDTQASSAMGASDTSTGAEAVETGQREDAASPAPERADKPVGDPLGAEYDDKVTFVNWNAARDDYDVCDIMDGSDFSDSSIVFLDPLQFATDHGLWKGEKSVSKIDYITLEDEEVPRYLVGLKLAADTVRRLLDNGAILVVRSNLPNSHIKVAKKSSAGQSTYTQGLVSSFFWLEELVGGFSFNYCNHKRLKFLHKEHPLAREFDGVEINCVQTLNSIGHGRIEVIASSGASPAITKISFVDTPGRVYLIPYFQLENETERLVDAFRKVLHSPDSSTVKPDWVSHQSVHLSRTNPYPALIEKAEKEIERLEALRDQYVRERREIPRLVGLLYQNYFEMQPVVHMALERLGFKVASESISYTGETFRIHHKDDAKKCQALVRLADSDKTPIGKKEVAELIASMEAGHERVRPKGILLGNGERLRPVEAREVWFEEDAIDLAALNQIALVPTPRLFQAVCYVLEHMNDKDPDEQLEAIRDEILNTVGMYSAARCR